MILMLLGIGLVGCATPYKPNGFAFNGGFDSLELEPNYFRVVFKGNEKTSRERANDFALLRVSDLMIERNCSSFAVVKTSEGNAGSSPRISPVQGIPYKRQAAAVAMIWLDQAPPKVSRLF